jgi:lysophospholipase L1-like esterase
MAWPNLVQNDTRGGKRPLAVTNAAVNGSGYVSRGEGGSTFLAQVEGSVQKTTQMVLIFGSENDMGTDSTQLKQAVANTLAEISAKAPDARIVVVGPPSYTNVPEAARLQVRDEDRAAVTEAGAVFVDPIDDQWIMGRAEQLIGPDGDHPSVDGQHYLQANMEKVILANLPG